MTLRLRALPGRYALARLPADAPEPAADRAAAAQAVAEVEPG